MTELPILPFSAEAPITATASGFMIRFICRTIDLLARPVARQGRIEIEHDTHVGGGGAPGGREHRIQIELGDLREVRHQLRDVHDHRRERFAVHGLRAAHTAQDLRGGDAVQHRQRILAASPAPAGR